MRYFVLSLIFFTFFLGKVGERSIGFKVAECCTMVGFTLDALSFLMIEVIQVRQMGWRDYCGDIWNSINIIGFVLNMFVLVAHISGIS